MLLPLARYENRALGPRAPGTRVPCLLAGLCFAGDLIAWQQAIQHIGAGLATVLANMQVVIVAILGWVLFKERPSSRALGAIALLAMGIVGVSGVLERGALGTSPGRGVASGIAAASFYAGYLLLMRRGNPDRRLAGPLVDACLAATAGAVAAGGARGDFAPRPTWPAHGWLLTMALTSQVIGYGLVNLALPELPAVLTSVLLMAQPVATLGLAAVILDERPSPLQLGGTALILVGILVASRARLTAGDARPHPPAGPDAARTGLVASGPPWTA
jgi:drug/metabolite transporter (DMT)-like permease